MFKNLEKIKYFIAFSSLIVLMGISHEFAHHFSAALICGCFGHKTFNSFEICTGCQEATSLWILPTYIGPIFTFSMLWLGLYFLGNKKLTTRNMGFALIMANFPINRILYALLGFNDEQYASKIIFGSDNKAAFWITNFVIWILVIPPLWDCYKKIKGNYKLLWFLGYFILPFVFVFWFAGLFLENWLLLKKGFLAEEILGIPYLLLIVQVVCLVLFYRYKKYIEHQSIVPLF
nr:hypothetical protein [Allomuricauda sp.]